MVDNTNKPVAAAAKPGDTAATPTVAPTATPPRHDPVPATAHATKTAAPKPAVTAKADAKPAAKPVSASSAPKPAVVAKAATTPVPETKRKRGRPLGSKSKTVAKPLVAKPAIVKAAVAKPTRVAAKPVSTKPITTPTKPVAPRAAATLTEGSKTMTDTITKIQDTAKKFTGDAGARTQAMFGDFGGRAKGAYEKSVKMTEELTEFQKGNVEALVESSKLAAKAAETLGQNAADYARKSYETSTAAFKTFASAKSPTELFKLQSDYMKSYFDSAVAEGTKLTESWLKLAGDVAQPLSNRVAVAVEKVKATAAI